MDRLARKRKEVTDPSMKRLFARDPFLQRAREQAEVTGPQEDPQGGSSIEVEREEAQGVDMFADPDANLERSVLKEGSPGHETLTGDGGLVDNGEDHRVTEETHHR